MHCLYAHCFSMESFAFITGTMSTFYTLMEWQESQEAIRGFTQMCVYGTDIKLSDLLNYSIQSNFGTSLLREIKANLT